MILWFTLVQVAVAVVAGLLCIVLGLAGRRPSDLTVGALALVELLLIVQIVDRDRRARSRATRRRGASWSSGCTSSRRRSCRPPASLGAARTQPLEHRDHGHRRARGRGDGVAHARRSGPSRSPEPRRRRRAPA